MEVLCLLLNQSPQTKGMHLTNIIKGVKRLARAHVVGQHNTVGAPEVDRNNLAKSILSCSVPNLQFDDLVVHGQALQDLCVCVCVAPPTSKNKPRRRRISFFMHMKINLKRLNEDKILF